MMAIHESINRIRRQAGIACSRHIKDQLESNMEDVLYNNLYSAIAARIAYPILDAIKTPDDNEGPFI